MFRQIVSSGYSAAKALGIDSAIGATGWRRRRLLVLCWHGVSLDDEHLWRGGLYIPVALFRARLEALRRTGCAVLPLDEALDRLKCGTLPPRSVSITFDDGLYDFLAVAVPILQEFNFPATVYLPTYYVDDQRPVPSLMISYLLWKGRGPGRRLANGIPVTNEVEVEAAYNKIFEQFDHDRASAADKDEMSRSIAGQLEIDYEALRRRRLLSLITAAETRQLHRGGLITVEAHTHRHRTPVDLGLMMRELEDNNRRIEEITGRRPVHFCYPSGVYRAAYFPLFERAGYKSATTCDAGFTSSSTNPYLTPRLLDHMGLQQWQYEGWLSGLLAVLHRG
jgi:peptidoglycan/xylan/chitin deacetylase (PgdA/CDA1 family)